jgi:hypothetical protein
VNENDYGLLFGRILPFVVELYAEALQVGFADNPFSQPVSRSISFAAARRIGGRAGKQVIGRRRVGNDYWSRRLEEGKLAGGNACDEN